MYIAMNRFRVQEGQGQVFESAWKTRDSHLDQVPGFIRFQLLKGADGTYVSHTNWESREAFVNWTESEAFARAHRSGLPDGVLAGPPALDCFEVVITEEAGGPKRPAKASG